MKKLMLLLSIFSSLISSTPAEDAMKTYAVPKGQVYDIELIDPSSGLLRLTDGGHFQVLPQDRETLSGWLFGVKLTVTPVHGKSSLYVIQDIKTKKSVKATMLP